MNLPCYNVKTGATREELCMICCITGGDDLRMLSTKYRNNGRIESCFEMLQRCFNIKFPIMNGDGKYNKLCDECIARLRYCCGFRRNVEVAYRKLQRHLPTLNNVVIETKAETKTTALKSKLKYASSDYDSDDDHPLINFKKKCDIANAQFSDNDDNIDADINNTSENDDFLANVKQYRSDKYVELKKLLFGNNKLREDDSCSDWSVKTDQIYTATGYYNEKYKIDTKEPFVVPPLESECLVCPVCEQPFKQHHLLIRHYDNHFPNWLCDICGMPYVYRGSFRGHQKSNCKENERHPCPECDRTYKTKDMVRRHIKYYHKGDKAMTCYHCPRQFTGTVSRKMHMYKDHNIPCELYPCTMCNARFFTEYRLKWHMRGRHYNEINYNCDICSAGFFAKFQLRDHMLKHSDTKTHQCEYCEKAFVRPKSLKEHLKIHLNIRKFNCEKCGLAFVQKCSLNSHLKTHIKD